MIGTTDTSIGVEMFIAVRCLWQCKTVLCLCLGGAIRHRIKLISIWHWWKYT